MVSRQTQLEALLRGVTQKDMKQALRKLLKRGWEAEVTGSNHVILHHPSSGAKFTAPLTAGNRNAGKYLLNSARSAIKHTKEGSDA